MVTVRDLEKTLSLLRRVYEVVIVDTPAVVNDVNLAFLDTSDTILEIVTYDSTAIHRFDPDVLNRALGRIPEHSVSSGGALVVRANNEGIPFVLADPTAQISQDVMRTAAELMGRVAPAAARR